MKKRKRIAIGFLIGMCSLSSCKGETFEIWLHHTTNSEGGLYDISGEEVYKRAIGYEVDEETFIAETLIVLVGDKNNCQECNQAYQNLDAYARLESVDLYYFSLEGYVAGDDSDGDDESVTSYKNNYLWFYYATIAGPGFDLGYYDAFPKWGSELSIPYLYIFVNRYAMRAGTTDYLKYLNDHVRFYESNDN